MEIMPGTLSCRAAENNREPKGREVVTKSKAVKLRLSCYSRVDGMKNSAGYLQNKISPTNCKNLELSEIGFTRFFVV